MENLEFNFENTPNENTSVEQEPANAPVETTQIDSASVEQEATKRKRGRPPKRERPNKTQTENQTTDSFDFNNDFQQFNDFEVEGDNFEDNLNELQSVSIKESLLFLDGLLCIVIEKALKKNIEPMSESDAEFLASLAPSGLELLKPSKSTFFGALAVYYLSKALL